MNLVVTGSSGFVGTHLCRTLATQGRTGDGIWGVDLVDPATDPWYHDVRADIRNVETLRRVHDQGAVDAVIHLAAQAEVLTPWREVSAVLSTNVNGTFQVADALSPRLMIFASSSSVYGNAGLSQTDPSGLVLSPLSLYAITKLTGEMILRDWARETGHAAVAFRFGNVIGAGCRGLIPFLIQHVQRHPGGDVPARMRGGGKLIRDYVPVQYVVDLMLAALSGKWDAGTLTALNIGTGVGTSNGDIAAAVKRVVEANGFKLTCTFDDPPGPGEATGVVLDMSSTGRALNVKPPTRDQVIACTEDAALTHLRMLCGS